MVARLERLIIASSLEEIAYALLNLATMHVLVQADDPQSEWAQLTRLVREDTSPRSPSRRHPSTSPV